jgi:signal transduction histidine kinase
MYKRLAILSAILLIAGCGLSLLGYHSIMIWERGLKGARLGAFAEAAEQLRSDVMRKLDQFMEQEQNRPYTDYQYYYVPENVAPNQQTTLLVSPLNAKMSNGLAYGYFQVEPGGQIVTPYVEPAPTGTAQEGSSLGDIQDYLANVRKRLLPALSISASSLSIPAASQGEASKAEKAQPAPTAQLNDQPRAQATQDIMPDKQELKVESLQSSKRKAKVVTQNRAFLYSNQMAASNAQRPDQRQERASGGMPIAGLELNSAAETAPAIAPAVIGGAGAVQQQAAPTPLRPQGQQPQQNQQDIVKIRIEPFVPVVIHSGKRGDAIFPGQVFLLRHVKIEDRNLIQGFQLDEKRLVEEIRGSTRILPSDMSCVISPPSNEGLAYTAVLSFGFGEISIGLKDVDPGRIARQIVGLRNWYFSIVAIVFAAIAMGLASVWRNVHAQAKLAQKKDDFISAVSHELRTPLTSIRMHSEMLERNWVKSQEKTAEYYRSMRQESERLSRLVENVLDFSRIQKGRKIYNFIVGDLNQCVEGVVEMMKPYAAQTGFTIVTELGTLSPTKFDKDAVIQIVVNLLDNAVKYSKAAEDKTIYVRTRVDGHHIIIEVEDRGPGVPHRERKKVFDQFYRIAAESTRETAGTGLGLAIVKKFVEAHEGFVEIVAAKPRGALFRVGLPASQ